MDSKPFYLSVSFWGLVFTIGAPLLAKAHIVLDPASTATAVVEFVSAAIALFGIFRRKDIHVLPKGE